MKLNRLMGILMALMLLLNALGALAEEAAATPDPNAAEVSADAAAEMPAPSPEPVPPLYVALVDCGWTLYGEGEVKENSVVTAIGDPSGLVLSFVEGALPKLAEPNAQMIVYGYNNDLLFHKEAMPVSVSDAAALAEQVSALREPGRQSSLLNEVLQKISGTLITEAEQRDVRLMIFSGGAVNYSSADAMNKAIGDAEMPLVKVKSALDAMRAGGVKVSAYVWDLTGSARLRADHPQLANLLLNGQVMGENCAMIPGDTDSQMISALCDAVVKGCSREEYHAPAVSALKDADLTELKSNDLAVVLTAQGAFEVLAGEKIAQRKAAAAEGDYIRLYSAVNVTEADRLAIQEKRLDALTASLDADSNGALDAMPEVGGAPLNLPAAGAADYVFTAEPADALTVTANGDTLTVAAQKSGAAKLIVTSADGAVSRELSVSAVNYGVVWNIESGAVIYAGETADIAACADSANVLEGTVALNGVPVTDARMDSGLQYAPAGTGRLTVSLSVGGKAAEEHTYAVHCRLGEGEDVKNLTMKTPYFKAQADQTVQVLDAQGNAVSLEGFAASESALADVYFSESGDALFIAPKAAGAESIVLTHEASGQSITLNLTVESLFSDAMFWVMAAGVPVCLIGLTTMIVLLIVKLGGKRR